MITHLTSRGAKSQSSPDTSFEPAIDCFMCLSNAAFHPTAVSLGRPAMWQACFQSHLLLTHKSQVQLWKYIHINLCTQCRSGTRCSSHTVLQSVGYFDQHLGFSQGTEATEAAYAAQPSRILHATLFALVASLGIACRPLCSLARQFRNSLSHPCIFYSSSPPSL